MPYTSSTLLLLRAAGMHADSNKINKLQKLLVIHKINLLDLVNLLLAHVYYSNMLVLNYKLIRFNKFIS